MNENYEKNIVALKESSEGLVDIIEKAEKPGWVEVIKSENGDPNLLIKGQNNDMKPAYELENAKKAPRAMAKPYKLYKDSATILFGAGAGHLLKQFLIKRKKGHKIIVIEREPFLIQYSLQNYDFSEYINDGTILFACPGATEAISIISFVDTLTVIQDWQVLIEGYVVARPKEYEALLATINELLNQIRCNTGTIMGAGAQIADNDVINMPYVIKHRGVAELKNFYEGMPAVLISTGPSLKKNLYRLLDIQDKVIIIAVAQALRLLMAYGIKPDFITTVDFGEVNQTHFDGIMDSDVPLVCLNRTYATILKRYKGPKFITVSPQPGYENTACGLLSEKGGIEQGGSVSHLNLGLAIHLGCSPITLLGQDLAYEDLNRSHVDGADSSGKLKIKDGLLVWEVDDPNSDTLNKEDYVMGIPQHVDGYMGGQVVTNIGLLSFITSFESMAKKYSYKKLFNSTEGGARIKGFVQISLKNFIENYCNTVIDKNVIEKLYTYCDNWEMLIDKMVPLLTEEIGVMIELRKHCTIALEYSDKLLEKGATKEGITDAMNKNQIHSEKAHVCAKKIQLLAISILKENREIHSKEYAVKGGIDHLFKNKKHLRKRVARNRLILNSARDAAARLIPLYESTIDILNKYTETMDDSLLIEDIDKEMKLSDCDEYFETGNWIWPLICAKKTNNYTVIKRAQDLRYDEIEHSKSLPDNEDLIKYNEYVWQARIEGNENKDFKSALYNIRQALKIFPDNEYERWGLCTALYQNGDIDEAIANYMKLSSDFPKNHRYKFEYGYALMLQDIEAGVSVVKEAMEMSPNYDYFNDVIGDTYYDKGDYNIAIDYYKKYLEKFPVNIMTMEKLLSCYENIGEEIESGTIRQRLKKLR